MSATNEELSWCSAIHAIVKTGLQLLASSIYKVKEDCAAIPGNSCLFNIDRLGEHRGVVGIERTLELNRIAHEGSGFGVRPVHRFSNKANSDAVCSRSQFPEFQWRERLLLGQPGSIQRDGNVGHNLPRFQLSVGRNYFTRIYIFSSVDFQLK